MLYTFSCPKCQEEFTFNSCRKWKQEYRRICPACKCVMYLREYLKDMVGPEYLFELEAAHCCKCNDFMIDRVNTSSGQHFKGCSNYPKCKYSSSYPENSKSIIWIEGGPEDNDSYWFRDDWSWDDAWGMEF